MLDTTGFAVVVSGKIDVRTVSPTRKAAKVNGLVVIFSTVVPASANENDIEALWVARTRGMAHVVPVVISRAATQVVKFPASN